MKISTVTHANDRTGLRFSDITTNANDSIEME